MADSPVGFNVQRLAGVSTGVDALDAVNVDQLVDAFLNLNFDAVRDALAAADTPVGFNDQVLRDVANPVERQDVVTLNYLASGVIALPNYQHVAVPVTLAPAATHVVPGPAAGFIRVFSNGIACTGLGVASTVTAVLQPGATTIARAVAVSNTGTSTSGFGNTFKGPIWFG